MTKNKSTGKRGEELAARFMIDRGYTIIDRNWHCRAGEIDIVARQNEEWIFVEVRTRHARTTETAFESITPQKQERFTAAIYSYLAQLPDPDTVNWRADVVAVALRPGYRPVIDYVENALDW